MLQKQRKRLLNIVKETARDYVRHAQMAVKVHVKVAKVVAKTDVKTHVVADVDKDAKGDVTQCAKAIV